MASYRATWTDWVVGHEGVPRAARGGTGRAYARGAGGIWAGVSSPRVWGLGPVSARVAALAVLTPWGSSTHDVGFRRQPYAAGRGRGVVRRASLRSVPAVQPSKASRTLVLSTRVKLTQNLALVQ